MYTSWNVTLSDSVSNIYARYRSSLVVLEFTCEMKVVGYWCLFLLQAYWHFGTFWSWDFKLFFPSFFSEFKTNLLEETNPETNITYLFFSSFPALIVCGAWIWSVSLMKLPWISAAPLEWPPPSTPFLGCKLWLLSAQFLYLWESKIDNDRSGVRSQTSNRTGNKTHTTRDHCQSELAWLLIHQQLQLAKIYFAHRTKFLSDIQIVFQIVWSIQKRNQRLRNQAAIF